MVRKSRSQKYTQASVDSELITLVRDALKNHRMKKPQCPLPNCDWEGTPEPHTYSMSANQAAMGKLKRHLRDKHRAYYYLGMTKPFVINEEEEEVDKSSWLTSLTM
jgi:hypothetical protein